jgi:hypothetical protein
MDFGFVIVSIVMLRLRDTHQLVFVRCSSGPADYFSRRRLQTMKNTFRVLGKKAAVARTVPGIHMRQRAKFCLDTPRSTLETRQVSPDSTNQLDEERAQRKARKVLITDLGAVACGS